MSECRVVDLKELGVSKEVFDKIYSMGEQDGRADREKEIIESSIFFCNQPIEDIVLEARADAIDEFWKEFDKKIKSNGKQTYFYTEFLRIGMNLVEKLKENKDE